MERDKMARPERLLAIDVGNTNTVLGLFEGAELKADWRLATRRDQTDDEYGILIRSLFEAVGVEPASLAGAAIASVVPPLTPVFAALCRKLLGRDALVVGPGVKTGVAVLYDPPGDVGADRIVNAVAAFAAYGGPVVVVDFGTATTFDVVTARGEYLGGIICPGIGVSADALFERAARLPRVEIRNPGRVVGRTTVGSIQSGLFFGYAAMVEGILERIHNELKEPARVVATGGYAALLAPEVRSIEAVDSALTLKGLYLIWERNRTELD
jgi:type III pantothenate kinase